MIVANTIHIDEVLLRFNFFLKSLFNARYKTEIATKEFAIFEPIIFPIPNERFPFNAAPELANSSGADVPKPIKVAPITELGILNFIAIWMAVRTISSAPLTRRKNPKINPIIVT